MAEEFECDYDGATRATVQADPDGYVEVEVQRLDDGPEPSAYLYLAPDAARRFARTVTLASITAEGETAPEAPTVPGDVRCPDGDAPCSEDCEFRTECHRAAVANLSRPAEPAPAPADEPAPDKAALFLEARELAGPAANLDDVLKLAHHLAA
ncbi:hypothetical protein [Streptomyces qinglanensis]|uniref:hypothetical protein n=1 Tax=Streptomyces qinglanensis TaxID=943816 RepID=UPI003D71C1E1